jgi:hypothetical protein
MATVTGLTADRMLEIEAASVIDGDVVDGHLILTQHGGDTIDAGSVVGPPGPEGPMGSDLDVIVQQSIFDIGMPNQIRAGRQLSIDDFTDLGLAAPEALWNFSNNLTDSSGHAHTLTDKGSVGFIRGVDGVDTHSAEFSGINALYLNDAGSADPFRVRVGTFAGWVRTAKQGVVQTILSKRNAATQMGWWLRITTGNVAQFGVSATGTTELNITGLSRICDNRWHFVVGVFDGVLQQLYVDGVLESSALRGASTTELIFGSSAPVNIGSYGANVSTAVADPLFGRVDEVFVTSEIISADKIFNLYCAKILHALGTVPSGVSLNVYPGSKGASLLSSDFPTAPLRLHNFSNGSLGDDGSNHVDLSVIGTPVKVSGVDGTKDNAYNLSSTQRFTATDTGLPGSTSATSYGCWVKCSNSTTSALYLITWGTANGTNDNRLYIAAGNITFGNGGGTPVVGPFISDGNWHFVVVTQENAPSDGVKRKFYVDGRLVASSIVLNAVSLGGANKFVVGSSLSSASNFIGEIDTIFVTDYVLGMADITKLYIKSLVDHLPSPKNAGDHVQAMDNTYLLVAFDTLDIADKVSLKVMA